MVFALDILFYYGLNKRIVLAHCHCHALQFGLLVSLQLRFFLLILRQGCMLFLYFFFCWFIYYEEP
jgi:hypothetical protein